jgi:hypothetical protein
MEFDLYPKKAKFKALLFNSLMTTIVFGFALRIGTDFAFALATIMWFLLCAKLMFRHVFKLMPEKNSLIINTIFLGRLIRSNEIDLSRYKGIRNRISWTYGKHCLTELVGSQGDMKTIRAELLQHKITQEARNFADDFSRESGLSALTELSE